MRNLNLPFHSIQPKTASAAANTRIPFNFAAYEIPNKPQRLVQIHTNTTNTASQLFTTPLAHCITFNLKFNILKTCRIILLHIICTLKSFPLSGTRITKPPKQILDGIK